MIKEKKVTPSELAVKGPDQELEPVRPLESFKGGDKSWGPKRLDPTSEMQKSSPSFGVVHHADHMFAEGRLFTSSAFGEPETVSAGLVRVVGGNEEKGTLADRGGEVMFLSSLGEAGNVTAYQIRDGKVEPVKHMESVNVRDPLYQGLVVATAGDTQRVIGDYLADEMPLGELADHIVKHYGGAAAVHVPEGKMIVPPEDDLKRKPEPREGVRGFEADKSRAQPQKTQEPRIME